ncbi:MAG TPA: cytochrome b/b6 domain-containing protein [Thermodesulfobacteriota bacterium]|nr:cytochrome b/b6 domain-containing protein [Thermodesulfobacteriota bacterium]
MARQINKPTYGKLINLWKDLGRAVSGGYSYCKHLLFVLMTYLRNAVLLAVLGGRRINKRIYGGLRKLWERWSGNISSGFPYYRHPVPVRVMHWSNAVFLAILLMSGLNIFNAHPALNWGRSSYRGGPSLLEIVGFPSWLILPGFRWLAMARRWHFFFAWLLVVNGITFVTYSIASGHFQRDLIFTRQDLRSIGRSVLDHLRFRHATGEAVKHYNVLQKLAYLGVIFFLLPLMILMGLGMSPALDALYPGWVDIFFGRQSIRTIHFIVAWTLVLFVIVHVFEVIVTGFWNNLRSMITGYFRVESETDHE